MGPTVKNALLLYVPDTEKLIDKVVDNQYGTTVTPVPLQDFLADPNPLLQQISHVVVAAPVADIKKVLPLAMEHDFSIGLLPSDHKNGFFNSYGIPKKFDSALQLAMQRSPEKIDLIRCNRRIVMFKASVGRLPLLDAPERTHPLQLVKESLQRCVGMKLLPFDFQTAAGKNVSTAACGCMIVQENRQSLAAKLISHDTRMGDSMVSMVVTSPISQVDYFRFLYQVLLRADRKRSLPVATGYIKSREIKVATPSPMQVVIDGEPLTQTPLHCETVPQALSMNIGRELEEAVTGAASTKERIEVRNLPRGKEVAKAIKKMIPFFSYASEERFKDLFISLKKDARISPSYLSLMLLSTMLAAIGLYQSSTAVVIGAMLLAPLMAPIVSLAMGLLRQDTSLSRDSMGTIAVGVLIALFSAMLISLLFPHKPITPEMQARLQPSLLDLGVAVIAGVAGAYTKSNRDILGSLAGVSIAVALVPPLAVAGIGLGMGDFEFFGSAFLLFFTNLVGITLTATLTFRVLGFSPVVRDKKGLALVALLLLFVSVPLYLSYTQLVETIVLERGWEHERFLINDKYLIVQQATLGQQEGNDLLFLHVLTRESLDRDDLNQLKERIQANFTERLRFRVQLTYIP